MNPIKTAVTVIFTLSAIAVGAAISPYARRAAKSVRAKLSRKSLPAS